MDSGIDVVVAVADAVVDDDVVVDDVVVDAVVVAVFTGN